MEINEQVQKDVLRCEFGKRKNIEFDSDVLTSYTFNPWKPIIFDVFLLVAAVEFADASFRRPADGWSRDMRLELPVHDLARWSSPKVIGALVATLNCLTGDSWTLRFRSRRTKQEAPRQSTVPLMPGIAAVLPYSNGLDSWAVSQLYQGNEYIRVRILSKLVGREHTERRRPFVAIPFKVRSRSYNVAVMKGRPRGLKFAVISGLAAYLSKANRVIAPESGQGALGAVLCPPPGAYPDYRSHPIFFHYVERFLQALLERPIRFEFPNLWSTKGETLRQAVYAAGEPEKWRDTRSCWQHSGRVSVDGLRHCGVCAACMLRRLSVHAAGLTEATETYVWEDMSASAFAKGTAKGFSKALKPFRHYATAGVFHMDHLASLPNSSAGISKLDRHAFELQSVLGEPMSVIQAKLNSLLSRHAAEWNSFQSSLGSGSFVASWLRAAA